MTLEDKRLECRLARDGSRDYFDGYREKDLKQSLKELQEKKIKKDKVFFEKYDQLVGMFKGRSQRSKFMDLLDEILTWEDWEDELKQIFGGLVDEN